MRNRPFRMATALAAFVALVAMVPVPESTSAGAADTFRDDFDAPELAPEWDLKLGNAWIDDGWLVLQHLPSGLGPRDSAIIANEGADWSDYRAKTRFVAEGGGNNWYHAILYFRVADHHGWPVRGTHYGVSVVTPLFGSGEGPGISLFKSQDDVPSNFGRVVPPDGIVNDFDNTIEVEANGADLKVWVNGWLAFDVTDPSPIPAGGVGLGAIWESRTRFDYIDVTPLAPLEYCDGRLASIVGTDGDDLIVGTDGPDVIAALGGDDTVSGTDGDDVICGGDGRDVIRGMGGDDRLFGDGDDDRIFGGVGDDVEVGGPGNDRVFGGDGDDDLQGLTGDDLLFGHADDDELDGGPGDDRLAGGSGNDELFGGDGRDRLFGDDGVDLLDAGPSHDYLHGGNGDDDLSGGDGNDYLEGGGGSLDRLSGGDGKDTLRDAHGVAAALGGGADDDIRIALLVGWVNASGAPLLDEVAGGYGNDLVEIRLDSSIVLDITGDERDDPPSAREGNADELWLLGEATAAGSSAIKFEVGDTVAEPNGAPTAIDDVDVTSVDAVLERASEASITSFGTRGSAPGQFEGPIDVALDPSGNIVVADFNNNRVQVCTPTGDCSVFSTDAGVPIRFDEPRAVAVDDGGNIAVSEADYWGWVQVCTPSGTCTPFTGGSTVGRFNLPYDVAFDAAGNLVVADTDNYRIQVCSAPETCTAFGSAGSEPGQFNLPQGVAVDRSGNIVVADTTNHRVQICSPTGTCSAFGTQGSGPGEFYFVGDVAVDVAGDILVTDSSGRPVQVCSSTGDCHYLGRNASEPFEFGSVSAVEADRTGNVVIADYREHRVSVVAPGGVLVNDSDPDGDPLSVVAFDAVSAQGANVHVNPDGAYSYDPTAVAALQVLEAGESIEDTFSYTISDGKGGIDTATVTIILAGVGGAAAG